MANSITYVVAAIALLAASLRAEQPLILGQQPGLLLLRNGQVLEGKITPEGDRYHVALESGEVRVRAIDVEVHCRNLEEGYWLKRTAMPLGNVHGHLDLAQWCIQHELLGHAANELRDALAVDPHHPRIELLERRLKLARQNESPQKSAGAAAGATLAAEDLDRLVRGMPAGAVETFTTSIQPLLMNNCTNAGCHGPAAEKAPRFVRVSAGRTNTRRLTQRNLHATMELIDREKPSASPLLTVPLQPHGSTKTAVFIDPQSPQYRLLAAWVEQVAQTPATPLPTTVVSQTPPLLQTMPPAGIQRVNQEIPLTPLAPAIDPTAPPLIRVGPGSPPPRDDAKRGEPPMGVRPRDAFDPEIFNRKFFPDRQP